jgi:DNA-binding YbaB/EbfC family protein
MKMNRQMAKLMKQAQSMQTRIAAAEEEMAEREYKASAGGGVIEVVVNGRHELKSVKIDPKVVRPEDVELLEDLVLTAVNDAQRQADAATKAEMAKLTGESDLGGLLA